MKICQIMFKVTIPVWVASELEPVNAHLVAKFTLKRVILKISKQGKFWGQEDYCRLSIFVSRVNAIHCCSSMLCFPGCPNTTPPVLGASIFLRN
jgi:hypothetical protein